MTKEKTKSSRSNGGFTRRQKVSKIKPARFDKPEEPKPAYEVVGDSYVIWRDDSEGGESFPSVAAVCDSHDEALHVMYEFALEDAESHRLNIERGCSQDSIRLAADDSYEVILMDIRKIPRIRMRKAAQ